MTVDSVETMERAARQLPRTQVILVGRAFIWASHREAFDGTTVHHFVPVLNKVIAVSDKCWVR